jgi:hypothetical protein
MKKIFFIALSIRLICLYIFRNINNYDLQSYLQVGDLTLKGINIYSNVANSHHPYLPFFLYIEAFAFYFKKYGVDPILIIKSINIIFDLAITQLVYLLSKKNVKTTFLYVINPVTILITTLHGQFDVIPTFFVLLTVYLLKKKKGLFSILSFSFAILTKTWPVLFVIPIIRKLKSIFNFDFLLIILLGFFPVLFTIVYSFYFKSSIFDIGKTLMSYQGIWGLWGPWELLKKQRMLFQKLSTLIFIICFFIYSYCNKEKNLIKNILSLLFFFFIFTTNFSIQYFTWIIPFLILIKPKNYLFLIILISFYLLSFYYFWLFCFNCKITPYWLIIFQNIIGFILWFSFIKIRYLSKKIS